ncbi:MAG: 1-phosphofructokinase [Candidatus Eremiobacteraeota bacterium]|nr:1-phosphofructokinase [Candidatus Eremiobacteraeota bacterium]
MICTVTLNPAYDKTVEVTDLIPHHVNEIKEVRFDPGGKGINVSRIVRELEFPTKVLGIIGGDTGLFIKNYLENKGIPTGFVEVDQNTRTNLTIIDRDDPPATKLNEPGPKIDERIILDVEMKILDTLPESKFFVFAGSLPEGCPPTTYNRLIGLVVNRGGTAVLDTRGEALKEGLKAKPYLIKPNQDEASDLLGWEVKSIEDAARACKEFREQGIGIAVISLGKDGAVMACKDGVFRAITPIVQVKSAVGAGDSLVAGLCVGIRKGDSLQSAFKLGVACGTATATTPGTTLCTKDIIDRIFESVRVEEIDI